MNPDVNFNLKYLKKNVKWHTKKSENKRVVINKNDMDIDVNDEVYILSENQMQTLIKRIKDDETKINKLENDLKEAIDESSSKSDDEIHQLKEKHQEELNQLEETHEKEINKLKETYQNEKESKQKKIDELINKISSINTDHQDSIKEYQSGYQKALEQNERLIKEIEELKEKQLDDIKMANAKVFDYANKYNQLRQEIINLSRWGIIRNRHKKQIPIDYPLIQLSSDDKAIDIKPSDKD